MHDFGVPPWLWKPPCILWSTVESGLVVSAVEYQSDSFIFIRPHLTQSPLSSIVARGSRAIGWNRLGPRFSALGVGETLLCTRLNSPVIQWWRTSVELEVYFQFSANVQRKTVSTWTILNHFEPHFSGPVFFNPQNSQLTPNSAEKAAKPWRLD